MGKGSTFRSWSQDLHNCGPPPTSNLECQICHRVCRSLIQLHAHNKSHSWWWDLSSRRLSPWKAAQAVKILAALNVTLPLALIWELLYTLCLEKMRPKYFLIYSIDLRWFWWNLAYRFLIKVAAKSCKRFPLHMNNVSRLPCKAWNAHQWHATIYLLQKETPEFIPNHL